MEQHLDEQRLRRLIEVGRGLLSQLDPEAVLDQVLEPPGMLRSSTSTSGL